MRGGVREPACGARGEQPRNAGSESASATAASGRKVASVGEGTSPARQGPPSRIAHGKDEGCGFASGIPSGRRPPIVLSKRCRVYRVMPRENRGLLRSPRRHDPDDVPKRVRALPEAGKGG
jgi:hypothetical protein